jgi:hypothetical protein
VLLAVAGLLGACGAGDSESGSSADPGVSADPTTAVLAWDPVVSPTLAGYRIYYGTNAGTYSQSYGNGVDVGNVTAHVVRDLSRGTRYYFVATAYDTVGNESNYSNEVFKDVP